MNLPLSVTYIVVHIIDDTLSRLCVVLITEWVERYDEYVLWDVYYT